jgi:hypothetical protein
VEVQRSRIGSPVIGGDRDFEVAKHLFEVIYSELDRGNERIVENWVRESRIHRSYLATNTAYVGQGSRASITMS